MKRGERFIGVGVSIVLLILTVSCTQLSQKDIVGFAGSTLTSCSNPDKFSVATTTGCTGDTKALFCPPNAYVQKCMNDNGANVLNYCMNGFCGNRVLDMNFEQVDPLTGKPIDASGAGNYIGCTYCPTRITGRKLQSAKLSGIESMDVPTLGRYIPPQFTILGWVKPDSTLGARRAVVLTNSDGTDTRGSPLPGIALSVYGPNTKNARYGSISFSADSITQSGFVYTDAVLLFDNWNHIAVVFDNGVVKIYHNAVDRTDPASTQTNGYVIDPLQPWSIGKFVGATGGDKFIGEIDELRVVPRLLSDLEIRTDMERAFTCGNGFLEAGPTLLGRTEECDDGNSAGGDGCSSTCQRESCVDNDGDGYGATGSYLGLCSVTTVADCDDTNIALYQYLSGYIDNDVDGYGAGSAVQLCSGATLPSTYVSLGGDCDDVNSAINPGVTENAAAVCRDGIDNNCNGKIDALDTACAAICDVDSDAHFDLSCGGNDCNDNDATIYTGAQEICGDSKDNDCNTVVDNGCPVCGNGIVETSTLVGAASEQCEDACGYATSPSPCDAKPLDSYDGCSKTCQKESCVIPAYLPALWWDGSSTAVKGDAYTKITANGGDVLPGSAGQIGPGFAFTGSGGASGGVLWSPITGKLPAQKSPLTFVAWIKVGGVGTQYILSYAIWHPNVGFCLAPSVIPAKTGLYLLYSPKNGNLQYTVTSSTFSSTLTSYLPNPSSWHFVAITLDTFNTPNMKLYIDGKNVASTNVGGTVDIYDCWNVLGAYYDGSISGAFIGNIDEARWYNAGLRDEEISTLFSPGICQPKK